VPSSSAVAAPIPDPPPVTMIVLPSNRRSMSVTPCCVTLCPSRRGPPKFHLGCHGGSWRNPDLSQGTASAWPHPRPPGAAPVRAGPIGDTQDAARTGGFTNCAVLAVCPLTWTKPQDIVAARMDAPLGLSRTADKHRRYCDCLIL
jgi:hypothetical protein